MSCSPRSLVIATSILSLSLGCSSYRYMKDTTPDLERSRQEYVINNPGNRYNDDIAAGRVRRGMSRLQVRSAWGDPDQLESRSKDGETEVWAYQEDEPSRGPSVYHLRFEGELLTRLDIEHAGLLLPTEADQSTMERHDLTAPVPKDDSKKPRPR